MKLLIVISIILILFFYVWEESQAIKLMGEINKLKKERDRLLDEKKQLVAITEVYSTLPRIEQKAREIGLRHSTGADIIDFIER